MKSSPARLSLTTPPRRSAKRLLMLAAACGVVACGGGGGGDGGSGSTAPTVTSSNLTVVKYTQTVILTLNGTNLDQGLTVSNSACTMIRSTTAPQASSATTAYYRCAGVPLGTGQIGVQRTSDGAMLFDRAFTMALPTRVTFSVAAGATPLGEFVVTLAGDQSLAPATVNNFLAYVTAKHYDGTVFHRVYSDFVAQGGGYNNATGALITPGRAPIDLEVNKGLSNTQWTIAMARTSQPNSAQAQFYVNVIDNPHLDPQAGCAPGDDCAGYAVFGHVSAGIDVAQAIAGRGCTIPGSNLGQSCWPSPNVVITSAVVTP